ncbi:hypothetical protein PISMIDRAFT_11264 [Pisolithus microcarpus 441]|uniref:Sugar phosphate phosphatase n=1 Tax=Pisolithus microcarpus 441 TaxID=765257 RepID=A0A0C9Z1E3_9AGAM|nr:hypothetical protein PISMIDRAFT_11264 [Pisolithus microcarpus 441]
MFEAPCPPHDLQDKSGFALESYETLVVHWPAIIANIVGHIRQLIDGTLAAGSDAAHADDGLGDPAARLKINEGKEIISKVIRLKHRMESDQELEKIPEDGEFYVEEYNSELEKLAQAGQNTWFVVPWLFAESYLYRLIRSYFKQTTHWTNFDPFRKKKEETFRNSATAVYQIATMMHDLDSEKASLVDPAKLLVLFKEMVQMCLWGNATDLSFLIHLAPSDIEQFQQVGRDAQRARKEYILKDDQEVAWEYIKSLQPRAGLVARCDFVLDNAGFELFTDLVFADFLVTYTPYFSTVVFHPKLFPWFVSDVTPADFYKTIHSLSSPTFFDKTTTTAESARHLKEMVERWERYLKEGVFCLSTALEGGHGKTQFWTGPWPYWYMEDKANDLWRSLSESSLVIIKGDLKYVTTYMTPVIFVNACLVSSYRKLTGDMKWPVSTPFATTLGPLAGSFPLLSLRTNKSDVVVGVPQDVADRLDEKDERWRVSGKYAASVLL